MVPFGEIKVYLQKATDDNQFLRIIWGVWILCMCKSNQKMLVNTNQKSTLTKSIKSCLFPFLKPFSNSPMKAFVFGKSKSFTAAVHKGENTKESLNKQWKHIQGLKTQLAAKEASDSKEKHTSNCITKEWNVYRSRGLCLVQDREIISDWK